MDKPAFRLFIGGPVGSGKTALVKALCAELKDLFHVAVITGDSYDAEDLLQHVALPDGRIVGCEIGRGPDTSTRAYRSMSLSALDDLHQRFSDLDIILLEGPGDNPSDTIFPDFSDLNVYVTDAAAGEKVLRKGGPGIIAPDLLLINKIDLAPMVGANLDAMDRDAKNMRGDKPFVFTSLKTGEGLDEVIQFITHQGMLTPAIA